MHASLRLYYGNLITTGLRNWDFVCANVSPVLSESRDVDILRGMRRQLAICPCGKGRLGKYTHNPATVPITGHRILINHQSPTPSFVTASYRNSALGLIQPAALSPNICDEMLRITKSGSLAEQTQVFYSSQGF
jgi:hypothetical protein